MDPSINRPQSTEFNHTSPLKSSRSEATAHQDKDAHFFSVTIGKSPQEVFDFWRDFTNLPTFMKDLAEVRVITDKESHWTLRFSAGVTAEWDAVIVEEVPGQMISWQSLEDSQVQTAGNVRFESAPAGRGTIVRLKMSYRIPGGKLTELAGKVTGEDPYNLTQTNLRRLKAYLETGEIPTTEGQSSGRDEDAYEEPFLH